MRVAFLTCRGLLGAAASDPEELREHRLELAALVPACAAHGIALEPLARDDPVLVAEAVAPAFDAFVIGTAWDYAARPTEFLARLAQLEAARPLFNTLATVRWNQRVPHPKPSVQRTREGHSAWVADARATSQ